MSLQLPIYTLGKEKTEEIRPAVHPVELIQKNDLINKNQTQRFTCDSLFGTHMFLRFQTEKNFLSQMQRLPGLNSEFVGLETLIGQDETIDFGDYLDDPTKSLHSVDMHETMEQRLSLGVNSLHMQV